MGNKFRHYIQLLLVTVLSATSVVVLAQDSLHLDSDLPVLSLGDCISLALESSPTILVSQERQVIAGKEITSAYGQFLPTISLSGSYQKSDRTDFDVQDYDYLPRTDYTFDSAGDSTAWIGQMAVPGGFSDKDISTTYKTLSGNADLNLFAGFSKFSTLSSAKNNLKAAEASAGYTRQLIVENVISAYYNLLRYHELLKVAAETRDQAAKELERTETYFRLGSAAKSDVLQQRVRLENTKLDVVVSDNNVKKAFVDLAYNMNRPLASGFIIDDSVLHTDFVVEDLNSLYEEALLQRLDLESSKHSLEAKNNDVTTATSGYLPRLDVFANYSRSDNESPYKFGSQVSSSTAYGARVSWNIFDKFQTWTRRGQAQANARIAEYEYDQARMNVQVEIRQLFNSLVEARERANVSRETIVQSEEELRLAQERFRVGAGTTLDVIVAQVNLANSRGQEVQAMCDFLIGEAKMNRAVGRINAGDLIK